MLKNLLFFLFFELSIFACKPKTQETVTPVMFPNQDAPLALLMREIYVDMEEIKIDVEKKKAIKNYIQKHKEILTAKATDPKVKDGAYDLMAVGYLESLRVLETGKEELLLTNYKIMVSYCIACHEKHCPGPIKKIKLLQIP